MQNLRFFYTAIIIVICLWSIQISYNGTPSVSVFGSLISIIHQSLEKGWNFSLQNWTMNFNFILIEFLITSSFLLIVSKWNNIRLIKLALALIIIMWFFWFWTYKPYIEVELYLLSSIPFLITCTIMGFFALRKQKVNN